MAAPLERGITWKLGASPGGPERGTPQRAEQVAALFEPVGVRDEQDAALWIAEHETLIP